MDSGTASAHRLDPVGGESFRSTWADAATDRAIGGTCEIPEPNERSRASQELEWHYFQHTKATN
jgi:hypothetical protein